MLQHIKNNVSQNNLRFPQHHKLSTASRNAVLDAYQYVINLLSPLKINQCLRNQQTISIEELSSTISDHLGQSWARETDENTNEDSDVESDNETNNNMINDLTSNYDSDEDLEFDDGFDSINNVTTSANRGVRLVDNDFMQHVDAQTAEAMVFYAINEKLKEQGRSCSDFGIPSPTSVSYSFESKIINKEEELRIGQKMCAMLNQDQRSAADAILASHRKQSTTAAGSCFFIDGP
ncbi:unnamed protein product [Rotaria sp. Silwood2]|nr:unnamed protein product [Rotaria sp. Silwood2]